MKTELSDQSVVDILKTRVATIGEEVDLYSRDALQPVFDGLSEEEVFALANLLENRRANLKPYPLSYTHFLLTLDPKTLAYAIAEVISK